MPAWRAGQGRALKLLGQAGMSAINTVADSIPRD
jgi:hypothetical protein